MDGYTSEIETQPKVDVDSVDIMAKINNIASGDLMIQKTVSGNRGDANRFFTFRIELDEPINGLYGSTIFEDGVANVLLRHGQTIEIPDLPGNVGYTVTEVEANQYCYTTTNSGNTTGMILPNETVTVSFENRNHYIPDPEDHPTWTPQPSTGYQFVLTDDK